MMLPHLNTIQNKLRVQITIRLIVTHFRVSSVILSSKHFPTLVNRGQRSTRASLFVCLAAFVIYGRLLLEKPPEQLNLFEWAFLAVFTLTMLFAALYFIFDSLKYIFGGKND
jgi:hypothetical protein